MTTAVHDSEYSPHPPRQPPPGIPLVVSPKRMHIHTHTPLRRSFTSTTVVGCLDGWIGHDSMMPAWMVLLGSTLDALGEPAEPGAEAIILEDVKEFCILFMIFGDVSGLSGCTFVALWSVSGERQALRMRRAYVKCTLKQDIGWFDEHPAGQLPTGVTTNMAKVQDDLGRKTGDIVFNGLGGDSARASEVAV
ncbi:unnamed protein product, partial [Ectocarpus sp. 13 AM-2016]